MTPLSLFLFLSTLLILPLSAEQAVTYPSTKKWDYIGCYNETSPQEIGPRILSGGIDEALPGMTVPMCLAFCFSNFFKFAGVEYAQFVSSPFPCPPFPLPLSRAASDQPFDE